MAFNFSEIIAAETKKQEEASKSGGGGLGFKTVYPFANGRLEFRLLGNEPSELLYRELNFHEYWSDNKKQKVPCLHQMYGINCPICDAVSNVQNTFDDKDVYSKYGCKKQGIMFAKLISVSPDNYFGDTRNPAKPGDIVLFMFPKSVINELRNLIVEYSDDLENIFALNTARTVTLKVGTQANGFPEYAFYVKGSSDTLCVDANGTPDDAAFSDFMLKLPNLKEVKFPSAPDDDMMNIHRTIVEEINRKYYGAQVGNNTMTPPAQMTPNTSTAPVNPGYTTNTVNTNIPTNTAPAQPVQNTPQTNSVPAAPVNTTPPVQNTTVPTNSAPVNTAPVQNTAETNGTENETKTQRPACFGNNQYNETCAACPYDAECV